MSTGGSNGPTFLGGGTLFDEDDDDDDDDDEDEDEDE